MCANPWLCHNPQPHDAPHGCVHISGTGSHVDDHHQDGGHG